MWLSWLPLTTAKANGSAVVKQFNLSLSLSLRQIIVTVFTVTSVQLICPRLSLSSALYLALFVCPAF